MVRPNQIIESNIEENELTFIMFARTEKQVKRRVLLLNFPSLGLQAIKNPDKFVKRIQLVTEGMVNRWAVTVDTERVNNA